MNILFNTNLILISGVIILFTWPFLVPFENHKQKVFIAKYFDLLCKALAVGVAAYGVGLFAELFL